MNYPVTYKILTDPSEEELNAMAEQGWRVAHFACPSGCSEYGTLKFSVKIIMERRGNESDSDRL